jgi:hypothetical protein
MFRKHAAGVRNAYDHCFGTFFHSPLNTQIGNVAIGLATRQPELANAPIAAPINNSMCGLCRELIQYIA